MLVKATRLALVAAALVLVTTGADAQNHQRRCAKTKDPVKCTCFFSNNGQIANRGGKRRAVIWSIGEFDGYVACMKRNGRALS